MSRKNKIIVSIVGISIVLLTLLGLTYAYFLTRIQGNTNDKSISVTTADLKLVYGDNSAEILGENLKLVPSDTEIGTKTFTVTNDGNAKTSYVVVIEDVSITKEDTTTTFKSNDFRYTLTCTKKDGTNCDGVNTQSVFPINGGILVGNNIDVSDIQTYTFKMWYIDTGVDQSNDMGKHLQAKINITNIENINPYSSNTNSLAYNIIENAKNKTNGTELLASPKSKPAYEISYEKGSGKLIDQELDMSIVSNWVYGSTYENAQPWNGGRHTGTVSGCSNEIVGKYISYPSISESWYVKSCKTSTVAIVSVEEKEYESSLQITNDDYGSSYYYRGNILDNYVDFANMCFRIVRIQGDGSIKLILEDQDNTCATSNGNWNIPITISSTINKGNFGYTEYAANALTASDGTKNSSKTYIMNYLSGTNNTSSMAYAFKNFQTGLLASYLDKLKSGDWCLNDKAYASNIDNTTPLTSTEILDKQIKGTSFYYDSQVRLNGKTTKETTLKCNGTNMTKFSDNTDMYVGTLTADEITYAGGKANVINYNYYLVNEFQKINSLYFWTLSPYFYANSFDVVYIMTKNGSLANGDSSTDGSIKSSNSFRPAIILKPNIAITSGDGTKNNAYKIS